MAAAWPRQLPARRKSLNFLRMTGTPAARGFPPQNPNFLTARAESSATDSVKSTCRSAPRRRSHPPASSASLVGKLAAVLLDVLANVLEFARQAGRLGACRVALVMLQILQQPVYVVLRPLRKHILNASANSQQEHLTEFTLFTLHAAIELAAQGQSVATVDAVIGRL